MTGEGILEREFIKQRRMWGRTGEHTKYNHVEMGPWLPEFLSPIIISDFSHESCALGRVYVG